MKIILFVISLSISGFAADYQLQMAFPKEWKVNYKKLKKTCNCNGYYYWKEKNIPKYASIPVVDKKGNMVKCNVR